VNNINFNQNFETINSIPYAGRIVTFSFYARAGANYSAASSGLRVNLVTGTGTDQNAYSGYTGAAAPIDVTPTLTTTWQRFSYTGTIATSATEISPYFFYTPVGTAGADDYVEFTGVQLEQNYQPTPFEQRPIGVELALCQRYYTLVASGNGVFVGNSAMQSATAFETVVPLPVPMRIAPTLVASTGTDYYGIYVLNVERRAPSIANQSNSPLNLRLYGTLTTSTTVGSAGGFYTTNASTSIAASAEL
jgi:hypothetical protein